MTKRISDPGWLLRQAREAFSWTGISWFVALLAGIWGAMIGIGSFAFADASLMILLLLCVLKWGHATDILNHQRKQLAFWVGTLLLIAFTAWLLAWTHRRYIQTQEDAKKLEPLKELPGLQKRLDSLPELQEKIRLLQAANVAANDSLAKKQDLIEGLTQTVVSQQQIAAERAHKELKATENVLNTNINQYRTDTTTAVGRILRPPRTLGDRRAALVSLLRLSGPHDIAITPARGSQEAIAFASELEAAFKDAGWKIVRTQKLVFLIKDGIGLELQVQPMPTLKDGDIIPFDLLTPGQAAVAKAFSGAGIQLISNGVENGMTGPTELYVGLQ